MTTTARPLLFADACGFMEHDMHPVDCTPDTTPDRARKRTIIDRASLGQSGRDITGHKPGAARVRRFHIQDGEVE